MSTINPTGTGGNTINPQPLDDVSEWANYPAINDLNMNGFSIINTTFDLSDQILDIKDLIVESNIQTGGDYTSTGNITVSGDIDCDDLRIRGSQITDGSGNLLRYGIQLGGGVSLQHPPYDGPEKVGLFQRDISYNILWVESPNVGEGKEQGGTGLQIYDLNSEYTNPGANNAGSLAFGNQNSFGNYAVQYAKIGGIREGGFAGGMILKTMRTGSGLLYPAMRINSAQMVQIGGIPYNSAGSNDIGGLITPLKIRASNGGNTTGQHIDLQQDDYALGVQPSTFFVRTNADFSIYNGGVFSNAQNDPGTGGSNLATFSTGGLDMQNLPITSLATPTASNDAATKDQVDAHPSATIPTQTITIPASGTAGPYLIDTTICPRIYVDIDRSSLAGGNGTTQVIELPTPDASRAGQEIVMNLWITGNLAQIQFTNTGGYDMLLQWATNGASRRDLIVRRNSLIKLFDAGTTNCIVCANYTGVKSGPNWNEEIQAQRTIVATCQINTQQQGAGGSAEWVWLIRSQATFTFS